MFRSITLSILLFSNLLDARTKREEAKIKAAQDAVSSLTYEIQQQQQAINYPGKQKNRTVPTKLDLMNIENDADWLLQSLLERKELLKFYQDTIYCKYLDYSGVTVSILNSKSEIIDIVNRFQERLPKKDRKGLLLQIIDSSQSSENDSMCHFGIPQIFQSLQKKILNLEIAIIDLNNISKLEIEEIENTTGMRLHVFIPDFATEDGSEEYHNRHLAKKFQGPKLIYKDSQHHEYYHYVTGRVAQDLLDDWILKIRKPFTNIYHMKEIETFLKVDLPYDHQMPFKDSYLHPDNKKAFYENQYLKTRVLVLDEKINDKHEAEEAARHLADLPGLLFGYVGNRDVLEEFDKRHSFLSQNVMYAQNGVHHRGIEKKSIDDAFEAVVIKNKDHKMEQFAMHQHYSNNIEHTLRDFVIRESLAEKTPLNADSVIPYSDVLYDLDYPIIMAFIDNDLWKSDSEADDQQHKYIEYAHTGIRFGLHHKVQLMLVHEDSTNKAFRDKVLTKRKSTLRGKFYYPDLVLVKLSTGEYYELDPKPTKIDDPNGKANPRNPHAPKQIEVMRHEWLNTKDQLEAVNQLGTKPWDGILDLKPLHAAHDKNMDKLMNANRIRLMPKEDL